MLLETSDFTGQFGNYSTEAFGYIFSRFRTSILFITSQEKSYLDRPPEKMHQCRGEVSCRID